MAPISSLFGHIEPYDDAVDPLSLPKLRGRHVGKLFPPSFATVASNLRKMGITRLFPVQHALLDFLATADASPDVPRDVAICAPTGSGKTLAFALAIASECLDRPVRTLRALVISPTRVLASQTKSFLTDAFAGTEVRVAGVLGETSRENEAASLTPTSLGVYNADVAVCTPGRLADALAVPGAGLAALRLLVADETDRILGATFAGCIGAVQRAAGVGGALTAVGALARPPILRKIVVSATLTVDPGRIAALQLIAPALIAPNSLSEAPAAAAPAAALPAGLSEAVLVADADVKLFVLYLTLLGQISSVSSLTSAPSPSLVFTNTTEQMAQIATLFQLMSHPRVRVAAGVSDSLPVLRVAAAAADGAGLRALSSAPRQLDALIATDGLARGVDLDLPMVVSAQPPRHHNTYVHRAGRTARAYRAGLALTVAGSDEVFHTRKVIGAVHPDANNARKAVSVWAELGDADGVAGASVDAGVAEALYKVYELSLRLLQRLVSGRRRGRLGVRQLVDDVVADAIQAEKDNKD